MAGWQVGELVGGWVGGRVKAREPKGRKNTEQQRTARPNESKLLDAAKPREEMAAAKTTHSMKQNTNETKYVAARW